MAITIANALCIATVAVLALADLSDLFSYLGDPSSYVFGTEIAGFRYASTMHFIGAIGATLVGAMIVIAIPRLVPSAAVVLGARVFLVGGLLGLTFLCQ